MMKLRIVAALAIAVMLWACSKVPITNRRQFHLLPESELITMANTEYNKFLATKTKVPDTDANTIMVKKIGNDIRMAITNYLTKQNKQKRVAGYKWEFNLVQDNTVNAWCMPGGKVVVYTGLLPVTKDQNGLAVVMGHEVAHAIARHGNERMSQQLAIQTGGSVLAVAMQKQPQVTQQVFTQAYGIGSSLGALAYSRKHETEADKLGLCFMAMAGYDPNHAVPFWQRMADAGSGANLQILSTHPSDAQRIKDIKAFLPTALKYYKKS